MNSFAACYRRITENEIINQTLPRFFFEKGVKYNDDYWFESSSLALPSDSAVRLAKTIRDKGQFSPLEYIGVPSPLLNGIHDFRDSKKTTLKWPIMHDKWFKKHCRVQR